MRDYTFMIRVTAKNDRVAQMLHDKYFGPFVDETDFENDDLFDIYSPLIIPDRVPSEDEENADLNWWAEVENANENGINRKPLPDDFPKVD